MLQRTPIIIIVVTLSVLFIGGIGLSIARSSGSLETVTLKPTAYADNIGKADKNNTFKIVVDGTQLVNGPTKISVKKGASVRIDIIAKHGESKLWLEGYNIVTESNPQAPGAFSFIANATGDYRFYAMPNSGDDSSGLAVGEDTPIPLGTITITK